MKLGRGEKRGKRGSDAEHTLAIVGVLMWAIWIVLNGFAPITLVFGPIALVVSISEYRRWLRRERSSSGRREGEFVYPRWAWFAVGAVPATFLVGVVAGLILDISGRTLEAEIPSPVYVLGIAAWIAGGVVTERLLVRGAERREREARSAAPTLPPPPPGTPPATSDASAKKERPEPAPRPNPDHEQDPRRF